MQTIPFDWSIKPADPLDRLLGQLVSTSASDATQASAVLFGLPFDGAVLGRKGAAGGPVAIRQAAKTLKAHHFSNGTLNARVFDCGDAQISTLTVDAAHAEAKALALEARKRAKASNQDAIVIGLGGDHSLAYPCVTPYLDEFGSTLAVINLDAHLDIRRTPPGQAQNSGTAFQRLLEQGLSSYTVLGARSFQTSTEYVYKMQQAGGSVVTANTIFERGVAAVVAEALSKLPPGCRAIYLSIDLDVADASVAPGVSAPTPGGLFAHQVFELVRLFAQDTRTVAAGIFELAPNLEEPNNDRTARLGAGCLAELLASRS
jgi:formimidoylglutamase